MLKPETKLLWEFVKKQPSLDGFVLIGGTALALHLNHRISEDLDLAYPDRVLPKSRLDVFVRSAEDAGITLQRNDDPAALEDFSHGGGDLHSYQQDFLANHQVKISFLAPDSPTARILEKREGHGVRIASLEEIFKAKSLVSALRSKSRDWFDLYILMKEHGFTLADYREAFAQADILPQYEIGLGRMCSGVPQKDDEGLEGVHRNPPGIDEMAAFFQAKRQEFEIELARRTLSETKGNHPASRSAPARTRT